MDFKIDINPEDINRAVVDAVTKSAIGAQLHKIISAQVESLTRSYNNPMEGVVANIIGQMVRDLLMNEFKEKIDEAVRERFTLEIQNKLIDSAWQALMNK